MIPEDSFDFNRFSPSGNFDHPEVRWPHLLQQDTVPIMEAGRHLLLVCPVCKHPWYKADRHEYPRLTPEQLAFLGTALQVDIQALYLLPRAICPICSALHLGGMFSVEGYPHDGGYRFRWESVSPRRIQLLAIICRGQGLVPDVLVRLAALPFAELTGETRAVLTWLEACPSPETMHVLTHEQRQHLAHCYPAGNTADGRTCQWRGYAWETTCSPLGGEALVLLAVALPTSTLPPFSSLRQGWGVLARAMRTVL